LSGHSPSACGPLLRTRDERPRCCPAEQRDKIAPAHVLLSTRGLSLSQCRVVHHSKLGRPMSQMGHSRRGPSEPIGRGCPNCPKSRHTSPPPPAFCECRHGGPRASFVARAPGLSFTLCVTAGAEPSDKCGVGQSATTRPANLRCGKSRPVSGWLPGGSGRLLLGPPAS